MPATTRLDEWPQTWVPSVQACRACIPASSGQFSSVGLVLWYFCSITGIPSRWHEAASLVTCDMKWGLVQLRVASGTQRPYNTPLAGPWDGCNAARCVWGGGGMRCMQGPQHAMCQWASCSNSRHSVAVCFPVSPCMWFSQGQNSCGQVLFWHPHLYRCVIFLDYAHRPSQLLLVPC